MTPLVCTLKLFSENEKEFSEDHDHMCRKSSWGNLSHDHRSPPPQAQVLRGPWPYERPRKFLTKFMPISLFKRVSGNEKCARTFFAQTFWTPLGVRDIPAKFSRDIPDSSLRIPRKTNFRGRARTFRPPPLRVKDPHPTGWSPDPKS